MTKKRFNNTIISFVVAIMMLITSNVMAQDNQQDQTKDDQQKVQPQEQTQDQNMQNDQRFEKTAQDLSKDLQATIDLSDQQVAQVQAILVDYQEDIVASANLDENAETMNTENTAKTMNPVEKTNSKIEALLDATQKAKWETAKTDWWKQVNEQMSNNKTTL